MLEIFYLHSMWFVWILLVICSVTFWYYFYVLKPLATLPSFRAELVVLKWLLSGRKITTVGAEKIISIGRTFLPEGIFVAWLIKPIVIIFNEDYLKNVMNSSVNRTFEYSSLNELFGYGLFISDRDLWQKRRKMYNSAFRTNMLKDKVGIFNKHSRKLVRELEKVATTDSFEIAKLLKYFSFDVLSEAVFGINSDDSIEEGELLVDLIDKCSEFIMRRMVSPWLYFPKLFPSGRKFLKRIARIDKLAEMHIVTMKNTLTSRTNEKSEVSTSEYKRLYKSFAETLLELHMQDPNFTMQDMLGELKTFIVGGYDTVSCSLNWCLFLLGQHPEVQDRIHEELKYLNADLTFEDLQNLTYLECVILETLRLYPPIPAVGRCLEKDVQFGKYKIPKSTEVCIFIYLHHRNPDIYPNPDKFDPGRFLDDNVIKSPWNHVAFSTGIRNCIGQKFAMMEMKILLAHIVRHFRISSKESSLSLSWEVVLKAEEPLLIKLTAR